MKSDIIQRSDIELLIDCFYSRLILDDKIGFYFNETFKNDWQLHLTKMCDFWENVVFSTGNYNGTPLEVHRKIHLKNPIHSKHFKHWLKLFYETVDDLFIGENAIMIKEKAGGIAFVLENKINEN
jgi:hemoglobin